jgi:hypothetical protein
MTIQITKPEVEALINQRLQSGEFKDAEDVILQALQSFPPSPPRPDATRPRKSLQEVFETVRDLADDVDFGRNPSTGRPVGSGVERFSARHQHPLGTDPLAARSTRRKLGLRQRRTVALFERCLDRRTAPGLCPSSARRAAHTAGLSAAYAGKASSKAEIMGPISAIMPFTSQPRSRSWRKRVQC